MLQTSHKSIHRQPSAQGQFAHAGSACDGRVMLLSDRILFIADGLIVRESRDLSAHEIVEEMEQLDNA